MCTIKNADTKREMKKVGYVALVYRGKQKLFIVPKIEKLWKSSVEIIMSTCAVGNFRIYTHDISKAYLQREEDLER